MKFTVVVEQTVRSAYSVEADTADTARARWEQEGDELPLDWQIGRGARVVSVEPEVEL